MVQGSEGLIITTGERERERVHSARVTVIISFLSFFFFSSFSCHFTVRYVNSTSQVLRKRDTVYLPRVISGIFAGDALPRLVSRCNSNHVLGRASNTTSLTTGTFNITLYGVCLCSRLRKASLTAASYISLYVVLTYEAFGQSCGP